MKKIFCILSILAIVSPAVAATGDIVPGAPAPKGTQTDAQVIASDNPRYKMATEATTDTNAASAGYVKGAYNAAIKAVNTVANSVPTAQPADAITGRAAIWVE